MIETVNTFNSFWLIICFTSLVIVVFGIIAIVIVKVKTKDNGLFNNIFNRHSDEHENTTDKMTSMHKEVVTLKYTSIHEHEFHEIEKHLKKLDEECRQINDKYDIIISTLNDIKLK